MQNRLFVFIIIWSLVSACSDKDPVLKIGLIADPQFADQATAGKRQYRESLWKLAEAMDTFNAHRVDFVQTLGDVIDKEWASFDSILPIYDQLATGIKSYQLLGNHDFSIDSNRVAALLERLGMPDYYYSYTKKGWRFIVLDATDYAYYSKLAHQRDSSQIATYFAVAEGKPNYHSWNGAIGPEQQNWLKQQLDSADMLNQKVILFSHLPLRPQGDPHNLWNSEEITELIEHRPKVVAFINGHNHAGAYTLKNGVHYITMFGMVDTEIGSYGILELYKDSLRLKGYGHQQTLHLKME